MLKDTTGTSRGLCVRVRPSGDLTLLSGAGDSRLGGRLGGCEQGGWRGGEGAGARAFGRGVKVLCVDAIAYCVCSLRATLTVGTAGALGPSTVSDQYE